MGIYLDYNASTLIDERVLNVMLDTYKNYYGNADSRTHDYGIKARQVVESARASVANLLKVKKDEVFFTSGATESNNMVFLGLQDYAEHVNKKHIITTSIEHNAVLQPLKFLETKGFSVTYVKPDSSGRISSKSVFDSICDETLLVSVMHANNETGIIQPVDEIGGKLSEMGILFHIDAAQSFGKLVDELKNIKYDMLSASAHKMYGPQGIGALVLKKKRYKLPPLKPIMYGGGQEYGIRPGTLPTALIAGFGEACRIAENEYTDNIKKCAEIKNNIIKILDYHNVEYSINGDQLFCMPNTINIAFHGVNSEALMLASKDYCGISNGSACNSTKYEKSYVLKSMGYDEDRIENSVRISWGMGCDVKYEFGIFAEILKSQF